MTLQLDTILTPTRCLCRAPGTSKKRVLETISQFIGEQVDHLDADELFTNLLARERLGSTGLGNGIAIPHCRLKNLDRVIGGLVTLEQPIDFEAIDDKPVDLLFVLIVPEQATQEHLNTLAALAELFSQPAFCQRLRAAQTAAELYQAALEFAA
jgi:PTS system nitrogen regulatory IIA component